MKLIPKALRPSERAKKRAEETAKRAVKQIRNEELKQVLDLLLHEATLALHKGNHEKVTTLLHEFILHDLNLRRIIEGQITKEATVSEATLHKSIELQSYYNMTRNNLLMAIIQVLTDGYNEVNVQISVNTEASKKYSLEYYEYITELHSYYIRSLEFLTLTGDSQENKIYQECMLLFNEIFDTAHESVRVNLVSAGLLSNSNDEEITDTSESYESSDSF